MSKRHLLAWPLTLSLFPLTTPANADDLSDDLDTDLDHVSAGIQYRF